ncbi:MAG: hypothetical protein JSR31_01745 [Nitrospira sp.]|nr:hypothetical protein [Nitrospira sp.]
MVVLLFSGTSGHAKALGPDIDVLVRIGCPHCKAAKVFLDKLRVRGLGFPLSVVAIGVLDGFNLCAMRVLLFLLSWLVNFQGRRKTILVEE